MKWGIRLQVLQDTQRHVCFIKPAAKGSKVAAAENLLNSSIPVFASLQLAESSQLADLGHRC